MCSILHSRDITRYLKQLSELYFILVCNIAHHEWCSNSTQKRYTRRKVRFAQHSSWWCCNTTKQSLFFSHPHFFCFHLSPPSLKPKDPGKWTVDDVGTWLDFIHLSEHRGEFMKQSVSGPELLELDPDDLSELGLSLSLSHVSAKG